MHLPVSKTQFYSENQTQIVLVGFDPIKNQSNYLSQYVSQMSNENLMRALRLALELCALNERFLLFANIVRVLNQSFVVFRRRHQRIK